MPKITLKRILTGIVTAALVVVSGAGADDIKLPDMGSPADAILSSNEEAQIGRAIMRDIRNSGQVVEDPLIAEYINEVGNKVAAQTNDGDHNFTFFVVNDSRINPSHYPADTLVFTPDCLKQHAMRPNLRVFSRTRSPMSHSVT